MNADTFLIAYEVDRWQVICLRRDGTLERQDLAAPGDAEPEVVQTLGAMGYAGQPLCVGLPSSMVYACTVECSDLPRRDRRTAMLYRLEEQLPLDAETLTASFVPSVSGRALGLAVRTAHVADVAKRLEAMGLDVAAICPTALLAAREVLTARESAPDYVGVCREGGSDVLRLVDGRPVAWYVSGGEAEMMRHIEVDLLSNPPQGECLSFRAIGEMPAALPDRFSSEIEFTSEGDGDPLQAAAKSAEDVLDGKGPAWMDFRRDGLAAGSPWARLRGLVTAAVLLSILLMLALAGTLVFRGIQYRSIARDARVEQEALYDEVYPGLVAPANVRSRLRSELARLSGVKGISRELPVQHNALDVIRQVTAALPGNIRLRITQVRLDAGGIYIEGQVRSHTDAEVIARALTKAGFTMARPRTERLPRQGVSFILSGKLQDKAEQEDVSEAKS